TAALHRQPPDVCYGQGSDRRLPEPASSRHSDPPFRARSVPYTLSWVRLFHAGPRPAPTCSTPSPSPLTPLVPTTSAWPVRRSMGAPAETRQPTTRPSLSISRSLKRPRNRPVSS